MREKISTALDFLGTATAILAIVVKAGKEVMALSKV